MKMAILQRLIILIATVSCAAAFAPRVSRTAFTKHALFMGEPAASKEEDLELTRKIIMDHVAKMDTEGITDDTDEAKPPENQQQKQKKPKKKKTPPPPPEAVIIDVSKLDMRVGVINKAWEHEDADKLFCEEIDIGEESGPRQIASGLRAYYNADDLVGQRVIVLANLKSRKLVGFPSHGMVMCASNDEKVEFIEPPTDAPLGERVMVEGYDGEPATENQVIKKKMLNVIFPDLKTNGEGVASYKDIALMTSAGPCISPSGMKDAEVA